MDSSQALTANLGGVRATSLYTFECRDKDGNLKWREVVPNLVTTAGLNKLLDAAFKTGLASPAWYVGLKGAGTIAAGDTASSHAGWTESTAYSESVRQTLTLGTIASGAVSNSASKAVFTASGSATWAGAFLIDNSTKGGTTGTLYGATDFGTSRSVISGDTLTVQVDLSVTAS